MSIAGWYYLHENGSLIYKSGADACVDIRDSDFARGLWPLDPTDRAGAWRIVIEAGAAGVAPERIAELAEKWACNDDDAGRYAEHVGANLFMDGDAWCATKNNFVNLQESPAGFGTTPREALTDLAKALGYRPSKMWGTTFERLLAEDASHAPTRPRCDGPEAMSDEVSRRAREDELDAEWAAKKAAEWAAPGYKVGHDNREAVRRFFAEHLGCTNVECAKALGLSVYAVGRHIARIRSEWCLAGLKAGRKLEREGE